MELADTTRTPRSTIRYHVRILEEEGLVFGEKTPGKQRYFPRESVDAELAAALRDDATGAVLAAIERLEPGSVSRLASDLDRASSTIPCHLDRLTDAGLVDQERDYGAVRNRLSVRTQRELNQRADGVDGAELDSVDVVELESFEGSYGSSG